MKLTRTLHADTQAFYGPMDELMPDVQLPGTDTSAMRVLLFVDAGAGQADGFVMTDEAARGIAELIVRSPIPAATLEVVRTMPGGML